jgi:hypothetical protein
MNFKVVCKNNRIFDKALSDLAQTK